MKKHNIIILLIIIAVILFSIPFFFEKTTNDNIVSGINLIAGFSSLLTLIIALLLFNKFGIETSLLEKQTKQVFELLENINKSNILIEGKSEFMRFNPAKPYLKFYEDYYNRKLLFSTKYIEGLETIWKFSDNVFLPKEIATKLRGLQIYMISNLKEEVNADELRVSAPFKSDEDEKFGRGNDKEILMFDFVNNWNELIDEIKNWISTNSSMKSELNLE